MTPPAAIEPPALRPSSVTPAASANARRGDNSPVDSTTGSGRGRGDGRGRGRGRGGVRGRGRGGNDARGHENGARLQENVVAGIPRRQFGGRLTAESDTQALPPGYRPCRLMPPSLCPASRLKQESPPNTQALVTTSEARLELGEHQSRNHKLRTSRQERTKTSTIRPTSALFAVMI